MIQDALTAALPVLRALGEPTRAGIVAALIDRDGRATVGELQEALASPQSTISRHLRILLDAGLVRVSRDGAHRIYGLDIRTEQLDALDGLTAAVRACQAGEPHGSAK